ncbi:MAG: hypothetical protein LUH22_09350 [Bacteroides sp.]|nr:hypothetical protein [Bacteroides sp.]
MKETLIIIVKKTVLFFLGMVLTLLAYYTNEKYKASHETDALTTATQLMPEKK